MKDWTDVEILAGTLVGEASNQGERGMEAIASVVRNRVWNPRWWGRTWRGVCLARRQFSCWDDSVERITRHKMGNTATWRIAVQVAERYMGGDPPDVTDGSDHYYAPRGMAGGRPPRWADPTKFVKKIKDHLFYRLEI